MFYLNMVDYPMFFLLLSTSTADQLEGVILSNFYSSSFLVRGLLHALKLWVGGIRDFSDSPEAKFPFPFGLDRDLA